MFTKQKHSIIIFKEANDWIPYDSKKQSVCSVIEEAYNKKVYNQLNPGSTADHHYKIIFVDGEIIHVILGTVIKETTIEFSYE